MRDRDTSKGELERIVKDIQELERTLLIHENRRTPTFPRIPPPDVTYFGIEGQFIVGNDDTVYAFSNGAWRDANT